MNFKAYQSDNEISKRITLPLAERMVQKYINENKIDAEQEIQLYLMILEMQVNSQFFRKKSNIF